MGEKRGFAQAKNDVISICYKKSEKIKKNFKK